LPASAENWLLNAAKLNPNVPMELFTKLFGGLLLFVYHCFDRIVNYLSGLSRPEQVEGYFTEGVILGSQGFVESHFLRLKQTLGYRRHKAATHLTALGSPGLWVFRDLWVRPVD